jgi:general secretion pathway protein G
LRRILGIIALLFVAIAGFFFLRTLMPRAPQRDERTSVVLRVQLLAMRHAIGKYRAQHSAWPPSLDALVGDGDLHAIPVDPVTHSASTWKPLFEQRVGPWSDFAVTPAPGDTIGIIDVHSGARGTDPRGRRWADY